MAESDALRWLEVLSRKLSDRSREVDRFERYYRGEHPLAFATSEWREKFGTLLESFSDNWCRTVVNAKSERMIVQGFLFGDDAEDADAWRIWQANNLDASSRIAHRQSQIAGVAYASVWPSERRRWWARGGGADLSVPRISVEHPSQTIVEYEPGDRGERVAALKRWDGNDGWRYATVYLPDGIWRFRCELGEKGKVATSESKGWERRGPVIPNPYGVVPIVPIANNPGLLYEGESELADIVPVQDAINKLWQDLLVASDYGAFQQRLLTGVEAPIDPETRQPIKDWTPDVKRFLTVAAPDAKAYSLDATDLGNFVKAIELAVMHLASRKRLPPHYLSGSADRLSGESIKSSETGLVADVREKLEVAGEAWEEVMRLAFLMSGEDGKAAVVDAQTLWRDPESRTEAEHVDAVGKKRTMLGVPLEQAWRDAGYTPQEIGRMKGWLAQEAMLTDGLDLAALLDGDA